MSIVEFLSQPLWQRLGLTLVHFLWQGLSVAVLVGVLVRVFRLNHGNTRYGAYLLAFIAMIVCPVVTFTAIDVPISPNSELVSGAKSTKVIDSSSYTALSAGDILSESEISSSAMPTLADSIPLGQRISDLLNVSMPWVLVIWMVGVVVLSGRLLMGFAGLYRWRHHLEPLPERLAPRIASLSEGLGMRGCPGVFISPTVLQAMAVGYLRPMVLLPAAMVTQMQPEMLEAVIAHELAHIRRFDLWINLAQRVTETLLFYHPAVWWLSNCLRSERELCCDELAVKATGERITYASTLENVGRARLTAKQPILAAGLGRDNKPTLCRVRHILGLDNKRKDSRYWFAGVIAVLLIMALIIPTGSALIARSEDESAVHVEAEEGWSEAVEGVQMRVRPEQQAWYEGETPKFLVDMRNKGTVEWDLVLAEGRWEVELDGLWYRAGVGFSNFPPKLLFGPGQEHKDIEFFPGVWLRWKINGKPLKFTPGVHTVRLSFCPNTRNRAYRRLLRVVSNPVQIEILPAEADKRDWGEAVAGLQCGLRADKRLWKAGETPKFQAVARNVGERPWRLPRPSELLYLKAADEIWRWKGAASGEPVELNPGQALQETTILLNEDWRGLEDVRLKLPPGKHIIQLVMLLSDPEPPKAVPGRRPIPKPLRIVSNVVAIEVLPTGESPGTVDDEGDAATTLQAELDELWRQRDQDLAGAEAFGKKLLKKYTEYEDKALINYQLAGRQLVVEGIRANRAKFECGYLAWSSMYVNPRYEDPRGNQSGQYELWWDGEKIATKYFKDQVSGNPEVGYRVEKKQGSNSYDGGRLSRKPRLGGTENWLSLSGWRGEGSQDWRILNLNNMEEITKDWSVVDANGVKLIKLTTKYMNEKDATNNGNYGVGYYDPSKGYGLVGEEGYNPDGSLRVKHTVKLQEVIPGGWFPVEVDIKSFAITDVKVYMHSHSELDLKRCSFNDKASLPSRVFKGAVDKQLKYQEKLQKYLAMELEGLSDVKEAAKDDKVRLGAREAIEKFVAAAIAGDLEKAGEFAHPDRMPASQIADIPEITKDQNLWIMAVVADKSSAIAVSSVILGDHDRAGPLVFLLNRAPQDGRDNWWVDDIDLETPDGAEVELKQFLEKHPKAQKVPYENKPAAQLNNKISKVQKTSPLTVEDKTQVGETRGVRINTRSATLQIPSLVVEFLGMGREVSKAN